MKITLAFNEEERSEALAAMQAMDYRLALDDLDNFLRSKIKYSDLTEEVENALQEVRDHLHNLKSNIGSLD
jgi:phage shock protein A